MKEFAKDGICGDATRGTNEYKFLLTTMIVIDEYGEGQPVGWMISNHVRNEFLELIFETIKTNSGEIHPKWIMSDLSTSFYDAFKKV